MTSNPLNAQLPGSPWTCRDTATHILAYRDGGLEPSQAERLFDHALGCDRCFRDHWQPFQEESTVVMGMLLDSLEAEGQGVQGLETITGDPTVLTVSDWMSPRDLPLAPQRQHSEVSGRVYDSDSPPTIQGPHLQQVGVLLPRVPKRSLMSGYQLYLGDGIPQPEQSPQASLLLQVRVEKGQEVLTIQSLREGVTVDSAPLARLQQLTLGHAHLIELPGILLYWQGLGESGGSGIEAILPGAHKFRGEPVGLGLLRFVGPAYPLDQSRQLVGRGERCSIRLPSREVRTNLHIDPKAFAAADPQESERVSRLTLDAVEVSREHAALLPETAVETSHPVYRVEALSEHPLYFWRRGPWQRLTKAQRSLPLCEGDELLIGQSLFRFHQA